MNAKFIEVERMHNFNIKKYPHYTKDYCEYVLTVIKEINSDKSCCIFVIPAPTHNYDDIFKKTTDNYNINLNIEHRICKLRLNQIDGPFSTREDNSLIDLWLDYSATNVAHIKNIYKSKNIDNLIYVPHLPFEYNPLHQRSNNLYTTILNPHAANNYRADIIDNLHKISSDYVNFQGDLNTYNKKSKILVNLHQSPIVHTFEELRVLPALLNGVVVVAEESLYKEHLPYGEYIIWSKYEDILDKTKEVFENYEYFYEKIHGKNSTLSSIFVEMKKTLYGELSNYLI